MLAEAFTTICDDADEQYEICINVRHNNVLRIFSYSVRSFVEKKVFRKKKEDIRLFV